MLTIKAPIEIKAKTSYVSCTENFYYRIIGNYSLMETHVDEEDLLHITNTPPEIYVTEGEGISSVLNQSVRNDNNYNKVEILNNVINRIVASAQVNLSYQDRVFITDSLYRLGIRDDRKFMKSFYEMSQQTKQMNSLINLYLEKSEDLRLLLEAVSEYSEKSMVIEKDSYDKERENYLFKEIFERLRTGATYQIVSNFNRAENYNEINKTEYSIADQSFTAQNILLSVLRERVFPGEAGLYLLNTNTYEEELETLTSSVENVKNEISSAVMMRLLQNIYRTGFEKFYFDSDTYFNFEDTFYKASDQIVQKLISNFGASQTRNEINRQFTEVNEKKALNEMQLFDYTLLEGLTAVDIDNIEELVVQTLQNNINIESLLAEYNSAFFSQKFEAITKKDRVLTSQQLEILKILGEISSTETLLHLTDRIHEVSQANGNVYKILSEYLEQIENNNITGSYIQRLIERSNLFGLLEANLSKEGEEVEEAVLFLKNEIEKAEEAREILGGYLSVFNEENSTVNISQNETPDRETMNLIQLLTNEEGAEFTFENFESIKNYIRTSKEFSSKEKKYYLDTITNKQIEILEKFSTEVRSESEKKEELIKLLKAGKRVNVSENTIKRISEVITGFEKSPGEISVLYTQEPALAETYSEDENRIPEQGAGEKPHERAELIYELFTEGAAEGEGSKLYINRNELIKLIRENKKIQISEGQKTETIREYLRQIQTESDKKKAGYIETDSGYEAGRVQILQQPGAHLEISEPSGTELIHEKTTENVTDEDIRRITENVNRIDALNEQRRVQYLEAIKKIRESFPPETTQSPFEKTRERAAIALYSPELLIETLNSEKEVRNNREKEILNRLKEIFPGQAYEIYQLYSERRESDSDFSAAAGLRSAEVGELIYDINNAERSASEEAQKLHHKITEIEMEQPRMTERLDRGEVLTDTYTEVKPVETVHRLQENLTSEEINEQLQMMQHNISRQIKEDVKSDVITSNNYVNSKEVITNSSISEQISAVNLQKMIDSKIQSEMNTISNQVMNKIERQMRNEKARRGY